MKFHDLKYNNVITFFTPRGPLYIAHKLMQEKPFKLIFDFQNLFDEGFSNDFSKFLF